MRDREKRKKIKGDIVEEMESKRERERREKQKRENGSENMK